MTSFAGSKLSKILARAIILPEDRSPLLALTTPIFCPDNNGVRAQSLNIIKPSPLKNYVQYQTITDNTPGEVTTSKTEVSVGGTKKVITNITNVDLSSGTINYMDGLFEEEKTIDFSKDFTITFDYTYPASQAAGNQFITFNIDDLDENVYRNQFAVCINATVNSSNATNVFVGVASTKTKASAINLFTQMVNSPSTTGTGFKFEFNWNTSIQRFEFKILNKATGVELYSSVLEDGSGVKDVTTDDGTNFEIPNITSYEVTSTLLQYQTKTVTNEFVADNNLITINLTEKINKQYSVPYEVDLKTDVNLRNIIEADMKVEMKKAINKTLLDYLTTNKDSIPTVAAGTTLAETIGKVIANNVINGTGCKFSIYSYDNGAPVSYMFGANELTLNNYIKSQDDENMMMLIPIGASKDDINVPAMYYFENPSMILDKDTYTELQQDLVSGDIKTYATSKVDFNVSSVDISGIGSGITGSNDVFALGFTEPKIAVSQNTTDFGYTLSFEMYYGIALVNPSNLRRIA